MRPLGVVTALLVLLAVATPPAAASPGCNQFPPTGDEIAKERYEAGANDTAVTRWNKYGPGILYIAAVDGDLKFYLVPANPCLTEGGWSK